MEHESSRSLVIYDSAFASSERFGVGRFLAGYLGARDGYSLDLRRFIEWCRNHQGPPILGWSGRHRELRTALDERGRARYAVARQLCTVPKFDPPKR
jgi:hypothetical protein